MKNIKVLLFLCGISCIPIISCTKESNLIPEFEYTNNVGYVIGYNPCSGGFGTALNKLGLLIAVNSLADTLIAYNFPDSLFTFPEAAFQNQSAYYFFFPQNLRMTYKFQFSYRDPTENEIVYSICSGNIPLGGYPAKTKQIIITSASKLPQ
jgi:hypothetical protein